MAKKIVSPFLPLAQKYAKELDISLKDLSVAALRSMFGHVYYIWRTFKPALGFDHGLATYGTVWEALAVVGFQGAMQSLNLKQVPDLVEELEVDESATRLDRSWLRFVLNEFDAHALEPAPSSLRQLQ